MAFDLTLTSATFNASGKFGQSLNGGRGIASSVLSGTQLTIEGWVKGSANGTTAVAFGQGDVLWVGMDASGQAVGHYGKSPDVTVASTAMIGDNAWHYLSFNVDSAAGSKLFVDGVLVGSSTTVSAFNFTTAQNRFGVRIFPYGTQTGFAWPGEVDEVSVYSGLKRAENFSVPTAVTPDSDASLIALWRLNGDGTNSAGAGSTPPADTVAPYPVSAQVASGSLGVVQVTMSEALADSLPPATTWSLSGGRTATGVAINGSVVSVTVNAAYAFGDVVTIGYTQPSENPRMQDAAGNLTATFSGLAVTNNAAAPNSYDPTKILFSPANWDVQPGYAKTINSGAYLRTSFGGSACTLNFDMTNVAAVPPKLSYRVDEFGPWVTVDLAASVAIAVPADTAGYPSHALELRVRSTSEASARWAGGGVKLTGVILGANKSLALAPAAGDECWCYGDSITEGINTLKSSGDTTGRSDSGQSYAYIAAKLLGFECGIIGFGRQGLTVTGNPDVPVFGSAYNLLYQGVARSFAKPPRFVLINQGTNDGSANILSAATAVLNNLLAALPTSTKIIVMRPFNGSGATHWVNAIAACSAPARVAYINTAGWYNTANSPDTLHPNGFENASNLGPRTAAAIRAILDGAPALTQRTVTVALASGRNGSGDPILAANLAGLKVSFHDEPTPDQTSTARYQSASETTDADGVLTFVFGSTLPAGGSGHLVVVGAGGLHYNGTVAVT